MAIDLSWPSGPYGLYACLTGSNRLELKGPKGDELPRNDVSVREIFLVLPISHVYKRIKTKMRSYF